MAKTQDLKPDIVLKNYWSNNEQFADIFNAVLFKGKQMIKPEELEDVDTEKSIPKNEAKEKVIKYAREHNVDKSVIMTVAGATNCKIDYNALSEKGDVDMCTLFDEIARENERKGRIEGRAEGKAEGKAEGEAKGIIETGVEFGLSENDILERLQNKLKVSFWKAQEYLEMFGKQTV